MNPFLAAFGNELVKIGAVTSVLTPKSTNVKGWRYAPRSKELFVTFKSGGTYRDSEVPAGVARALKRNKSTGKTIHKWVKTPGFAYEKVANGDMLAYFRDNPKKLREKIQRDKDKDRRKAAKRAGLKGTASERFVQSRSKTAADMPAEKRVDFNDQRKRRIRKNMRRLKKNDVHLKQASASILESMRRKRRQVSKLAGAAKKTLTWVGSR